MNTGGVAGGVQIAFTPICSPLIPSRSSQGITDKEKKKEREICKI
jgi:hypothetical protein